MGGGGVVAGAAGEAVFFDGEEGAGADWGMAAVGGVGDVCGGFSGVVGGIGVCPGGWAEYPGFTVADCEGGVSSGLCEAGAAGGHDQGSKFDDTAGGGVFGESLYKECYKGGCGEVYHNQGENREVEEIDSELCLCVFELVWEAEVLRTGEIFTVGMGPDYQGQGEAGLFVRGGGAKFV